MLYRVSYDFPLLYGSGKLYDEAILRILWETQEVHSVLRDEISKDVSLRGRNTPLEFSFREGWNLPILP